MDLYRRWRLQQRARGRHVGWPNARPLADVNPRAAGYGPITPREAAQGALVAIGAGGAQQIIGNKRPPTNQPNIPNKIQKPLTSIFKVTSGLPLHEGGLRQIPSAHQKLLRGSMPNDPVPQSNKQDDNPEPMQLTSMSNPQSMGRATPLSKIPQYVAVGLPEYVTTKMVLSSRFDYHVHRDPASGTLRIGLLGLNTPILDCTKNGLWDYENHISSFTGNNYQFSFRDYWKARYNYYSVIKQEWRISFQRAKVVRTAGTTGNNVPTVYTNPKELGDIVLLHRTLGKTHPTTDGTQIFDLFQQAEWATETVPTPQGDETTWAQIHRDITYADYKNTVTEIQTDAMDDLWTPIGNNPGIGYELYICPRHMHVKSTATPVDPSDKNLGETPGTVLNVNMYCLMEIQFKELNGTYKWNATD